MAATIIARTPTSFTIRVEVLPNDSMLDFEEVLQQRLNQAGVVATAEGLRRFDTDGRAVSRCLIPDVADVVAAAALTRPGRRRRRRRGSERNDRPRRARPRPAISG